MAIQQLDIRPQEGFNQIFTELVNNEIANTPYNSKYQSKYFFFKKRKGIVSNLDISGHIVLDYNGDFLLTRDYTTNDYVIYDTDGNSQLTISGGGTADIFVEVLGGYGYIEDSGTATGGDSTTLQDTTKARTDNDLAGYYLYIEDGSGAGQLRQILSNTSDTITVSGFDVSPDDTSVYKIYEDLGTNVLVPYNNGVYRYDGNSWVDTQIFSGYNIKDMILWNSRLWFVSGNQIIRSEEGDYYNIPVGNELFISDIDVNNLFPYGSYLFVSTDTTIGVIYKKFSTTDGSSFFVIKEGVSQIGVKNRFAINKYRNNVYFIGSDLRLYSIGVSISGDEMSISLQDNGSLPATFIDNYSDYDIKIYSDINYLYLFANDGEKTYEIYYNDLYKGRLNNEYSVIINKKKLYKSNEYVLGKDFFGAREGYSDLGNSYGQTIKAAVGEQDIWMWKNVKYITLLLGKTDYVQNGYVTVTANIGNKKISKSVNLGDSGYISDIGDIIDGTLGSTLLGYPLLGGDLSDIESTVSDVDLIRIGLNLTGQIIEFNLNTEEGDYGIFFGGLYVYYNVMNPKLKYYKNIL